MTSSRSPAQVGRELGIVAAIGLAVAWLPLPWCCGAFRMLTTLVHEFGHAIAGWGTGRFSVPSFDFEHGGGVTLIPDRSAVLTLVVAGVLGWWIWSRRANPPAMATAGALAAVLGLVMLARLDRPLITYAGHGATAVFAALFCYRFCSGAAVAHEAERWLYGVAAFALAGNEWRLCAGILWSVEVRARYISGKGGIANDFHRLGIQVGSLDGWAMVHALFVGALLAGVVGAWHQRARVGPWMQRWFGAEG